VSSPLCQTNQYRFSFGKRVLLMCGVLCFASAGAGGCGLVVLLEFGDEVA